MSVLTKNDIRLEISNLIKDNKKSLDHLSKNICKKIISSKQYKNANIILGYMALDDEVNIFPVIQNALEKKKEVFLPHVLPNIKNESSLNNKPNSKMCFYSFTQESKTIIGEYNIKEPQFSNKDTKIFITTQENLTNNNILVLVPGRAFTKNGERIGRGKGYYDYYLELIKQTPTVIKAGVCFSFQIVKEIPTTPNDVAMDLLFTSVE